jgi:hypothetical protein
LNDRLRIHAVKRQVATVSLIDYVPRMKPLPEVFAVQSAGDRWLIVYPADERTLTRTFERKLLRSRDRPCVIPERVDLDSLEKIASVRAP